MHDGGADERANGKSHGFAQRRANIVADNPSVSISVRAAVNVADRKPDCKPDEAPFGVPYQ